MQRKLVVTLLMVAATYAAPPSAGLSKTNSADPDPSHYLFIDDIWTPPLTYEQAASFCIGRIGGSYRLASLETKEEEEFVTQLAVDKTDVDQLWIGGKWNAGSNSFVWESGVPFRNGVNWMPGQPSERNSNGRVALVASSSTQKGLTTLNNNERRFFVCKFQQPTP